MEDELNSEEYNQIGYKKRLLTSPISLTPLPIRLKNV